jgi:hypothetical protein
MKMAYEMGLLDELMVLLGSLQNPDVDMVDLFAKMEDAVCEMDFDHIDELLEKIVIPALYAMTDEEVIERLKEILKIIRPLIENITKAGGWDSVSIREKIAYVREILPSLRLVILALLPVDSKIISSSIEKFFKEEGGKVIGRGVNSFCTTLTRIHDKNPYIISAFISDIFHTADHMQFKETADIIMNNVLDQNPPLLRWTVITFVKRVKKRLLGEKGGE